MDKISLFVKLVEALSKVWDFIKRKPVIEVKVIHVSKGVALVAAKNGVHELQKEVDFFKLYQQFVFERLDGIITQADENGWVSIGNGTIRWIQNDTLQQRFRDALTTGGFNLEVDGNYNGFTIIRPISNSTT